MKLIKQLMKTIYLHQRIRMKKLKSKLLNKSKLCDKKYLKFLVYKIIHWSIQFFSNISGLEQKKWITSNCINNCHTSSSDKSGKKLKNHFFY